MKEAFKVYLEEHKNIKAILVGTRRTDPHGENLTHFDMTDQGWPSFMRVHPVIDWHYAEIWAVCSLPFILPLVLFLDCDTDCDMIVVYPTSRNSILPVI
jgi:hypothetical protein